MSGRVSGGVRRAPMVVGREVELDHLGRAVQATRTGESSSVFLVGEGGVGKTRLLGEVATESRRHGLAVLMGRPPVTTPLAFGVIADALRSWLRAHPTETSMAPYDAGLRLVLPEWPGDTASTPVLTESQLRLLALEGVVRLVQEMAARSSGAVVLLDDLHGADPDSIEAIRYLATAAPESALIVAALRSREATLPDQVVRSLQQDGVSVVFELEPLGRREVSDLLGALLDVEPPEELVSDVVARTDGVPLLVEEVLDAHLRSGTVDVSERGAEWRGGAPGVPRTILDMVHARLERLLPRQHEVITVGAVLGDFEAALLGAVARQPPAAIGEAVAAGIDAGLLETVGGAVDFRHAVIREAVLDGTVPHVLTGIHSRAAAALGDRTEHDPTSLERRAGHLDQIGEHDEAARLLTAAALARLDDHAFLGAEALARNAMDRARDPSTRAAASDVLAGALAIQGRWTDALALDEAAARDHGDTPARRLRMATCAVEAALPDVASAVVARAIELGDESPQMHVIDGRLMLGAGDAVGALAAADRSLAMATDAEARCAALDLQGRVLDYAGHRDEAKSAWTRQAEEAEAAGLTEARLRAVVTLSKIDLFDGLPPVRLYEARDLARDAGALVEQAWAEENLAIALILQGDPAAGVRLLDGAIERCRDLRLDQLAYLIAAKGGASTYCDPDAAEALLGEAERLDPSAHMSVHTNGIRADLALRGGHYEEAITWNELCTETMRFLPGGIPSDNPCWLVWSLAAAGRTEDARRALQQAQAMPDLARWHSRPVLLAAIEAVLNDDAAAFDDVVGAVETRMPFDVALMKVVAAEILGVPARVRWLREALDIYESAGDEADSARVRRLLREAGGPVPRRRRVSTDVPDELAKHGVTSREADVLRLLGDGLSNAVIAERLYLSVRTVETHVSSLLAKLHAESRGQLTALRATIPFGGPPA